jgi:hypothetical protein
MGYGITKVVETLSNDHLRGLGDEVKRASVLMALSAAGIPLGDILQDSAQRQSALAACEVEQRKKFEEYWTRRAEKNPLLQSEMERVTRQYMERMNRATCRECSRRKTRCKSGRRRCSTRCCGFQKL